MGGGDSTVLFELMRELNFKFVPFLCDTGIRINDTVEFVKKRCADTNLPLIIETPTYKSYDEMVMQFGFPGAPQHIQMYSNLKEKSIRKICSRYQGKKLIITGVRNSESARRKRNAIKEIDKRGNQIWVSPIIHWDDDDKEEYIDTRGIVLNEVSRKIGISGDCLCGAYALPGELDKIKKFYPDAAQRIIDLQARVIAKGFTWKWDDPKPSEKEYLEVMETIYPGYKQRTLQKRIEKMRKKSGQQDLFSPLCAKCEYKNQNIKS